MFGPKPIHRAYNGYIVEGSAQPLGPHSDLWIAVGTVLLQKPERSVLQVEHYQNPTLAYENGDLAAWFGLGIAEISVDDCLPPASFHLAPMNVARAINIVRSGAEDHHKREIRRAELYAALAFLDQFLGKKNWLVRRFRNELRGDIRNYREKLEQREKLRFRFRGIQHACVEGLLAEINDLARRYRDNKAEIDALPAARPGAAANQQIFQAEDERMAEETTSNSLTLEELMVSSLAMTDALAKLMIAKGLITDAEFKAQLMTERANYLAMFKRMH